jgi:hypothetical protein
MIWRHVDIQGGRPCERGNRDWGFWPRDVKNFQELEEARKDSSLEPLDNTLIFNCESPEL